MRRISWLAALNARLSRWALALACACLAGLLVLVVYGVVLRYGFNAAPPYVEQIALLLVIAVAMFGASAGVRDAGHIGLDSVVRRLPAPVQRACKVIEHALVMAFGGCLLVGGVDMAQSTWGDTIPTLGISEGVRYLPIIAAGALTVLFSFEHLLAGLAGHAGDGPWN